MTELIVPLVGAHFRPPAKQVLAHLHSGIPLGLRPEPDNPYDSKAVQVLLDPADILVSVHLGLEADIAGAGVGLKDLLALSELHLGYIADSDGAVCRKLACLGNREVGELAARAGWEALRASLAFSAEGAPQVIVTSEHDEAGNEFG